MENSNQYDELLTRYLTDDLNTDEKADVESWLAAEPNRKYFDELKAIWSLTKISRSAQQIKADEEWLHFKQTIGAKSEEILTETSEVDNDDELVLPNRQKRGVLYRLSVAAAIAASIILVIGLGWEFFYKGGKEAQVVQQPANDNTQVFVMHHEMNTTGKDKNINMSDGSLIVLADQSGITYAEPFAQKRDVELTGKAFFKVAKAKPIAFTVTSRDITTTAIGTEFTVTAFKKSQQLRVRLHEGKVVVKPKDRINTKMNEDVYLLPGQELVYDYKTGVTVRNFRTNHVALSGKTTNEPGADSLNIPDVANSSWYMFNNQSLEQVFKSLSVLYNVKINYNKKDIEKIYFTGKYDKTESLETILKRIGTLHKLTISKNDTAFTVSK